MSDTGGDTRNEISGGFFSAVIQARDIGAVTLQLPARVPEALSGLPPGSASFTGREQDLEHLLECLAPGDREGGAAVVVAAAVGGMGGIGKTELAVQAAHTALARGWFPGGVLFVDMFGYDGDRRLAPAHAAAGFVRAMGIPGEHIPTDPQDLQRLLRSVLDAYAGHGRPVLVVIDNVFAGEQAAPLLPAHPACRAIVTSRHTLGRLGARLIDLNTLDTDPAVDLLHQAIDVARPGDTRITDHAQDARRIAEACGGLPLALQIVAALLADNPAKPLAAMAADLADQAGRLAELSYGTDALAKAFDLSYKQLPESQARLFRLLSANPGPDVSTQAAAALTGRPEAEVRRDLEALARAHLIEPGTPYGRWRMHDLIRLHSAHHGHACADDDQRAQALTRLLDHYLTTTHAADAHLDPRVADPARLGFPDRQQALEWLDAEYANLTAAALTAEEAGHPAIARDLPHAMWDFMLWRRHFNDWITINNAALHAARTLDDRHSEGTALNDLGSALRQVRRFDETVTAHQQAAQIFRDLGDRHSEGTALNSLGGALREAGRFDDAITAHQQALQIYRDTGDRHREGRALNNLGSALQQVRRFDKAITAHQDAAQIFRDTGDRHSEGQALGNLGIALRHVRRFDEAITAHQQDLQICRDLGDRYGEGQTLDDLGLTLQEVGQFAEAVTAHHQAAQIFHEFGDDDSETIARGNLQEALRARDTAKT